MFDMAEVRNELAAWVTELEPGVYAGVDALVLLEVMSDVKRLASAAETLLAARVAETEVWRDGNPDRSAAHWLARRTGTTIAEATAKLETAARLAGLSATAEAFRAGRLSDQQAREVVAGATADPSAEETLLGLVGEDSLRELRNESRRAQATDDEEGRQKRIHQRRSLRMGVRPDGSWWLTFQGTVFAGAPIAAALKPFSDAEFKQATTDGTFTSSAACAADGLVALATATTATATSTDPAAKPTKPAASNMKIIIRVDATALRDGHTEPGELCEIPGVGPVPVSNARSLLGDAALAMVITDGVAVQTVTHLKRRTTAHQRTALEFMGIRCQVKGCDSTDFVDIHHTFEWARHHRTRLDELEIDCKYHHRQRHKRNPPRRDQLRPRNCGSSEDGLPLSA